MSQSLRIDCNGREGRVGASGTALFTKWPCHQSVYAIEDNEDLSLKQAFAKRRQHCFSDS